MIYSWDKFLRPLSATDTNIQVMDNSGVVTFTINPYAVINVQVNNNSVKIGMKSGKIIIIPFSTVNEAKMALPRIKQMVDSLQKKAPLFVNNEIKNYVTSVSPQFFFQVDIPDETGTDAIKTGSFWYDPDYGYLYVYDGYDFQWKTAAGEVGPMGPIGVTGATGSQGYSFQLNGTISGTGSLPNPSTQGNAYIDDVDGHLWVYGQIGWVDGGSVVGTSGTSGTSGSSGTSATSGTSGTSATSGTSGTSGTDGSSGTSGDAGTSGTSGSSGTSATSGTSGTSATSGTSGTSGSNGSSGTSGTSGVTPTIDWSLSGNLDVSGTASFNGLTVLSETSEVLNSYGATSSTVNYDFNTGAIWYHGTASTNYTANFINLPITNNRVITVTILISQGSTGYSPTTIQIGGVTQSVKWSGLNTGNANQTDIIGFTFIRVSNGWVVLGQINTFV